MLLNAYRYGWSAYAQECSIEGVRPPAAWLENVMRITAATGTTDPYSVARILGTKLLLC